MWWLVSPQNPLKPVRGMASFDKRLEAATRLAGAHPRMIATGIEQELGTRFTIDTLRALKRRFPGLRFVWLMGSDNLVQIPRWRRWQQIFVEVPVAVVARPGSALPARQSKAANRFKTAALPADSRFRGRGAARLDCHRSETKSRERHAIARRNPPREADRAMVLFLLRTISV